MPGEETEAPSRNFEGAGTYLEMACAQTGGDESLQEEERRGRSKGPRKSAGRPSLNSMLQHLGASLALVPASPPAGSLPGLLPTPGQPGFSPASWGEPELAVGDLVFGGGPLIPFPSWKLPRARIWHFCPPGGLAERWDRLGLWSPDH